MQPRVARVVGPVLLALVAAAVVPSACSSKTSLRATASRVATKNELIGGPDALGDVGDFKLSNGKVRFIIQGFDADQLERTQYSRGWGVYAGAVLDADLVRPQSGDPAVANGNDRFGELFPALFLEAVRPEYIDVPCIDPDSNDDACPRSDGSDGGVAKIVVAGKGAPFLSLAHNLNDIALAPSTLDVKTTYSLGPDDQFLTITTEVTDNSLEGGRTHKFPAGDIAGLLGTNVAIPFGDVLLFGGRNDVFVGGFGFDLRYALEDSFKLPPRLPALNGLVTDLIATRADGVSYGFATNRPENADDHYVWRNRAKIPDAAESSFMVPFYASSFAGAFTGQPPDELHAGEVFSYTNYLIVGSGDVGSVRDVQLQLSRQVEDTGRFSALLVEDLTGKVVPGASLVVYDSQDRPYAQYSPDAQGRVTGRLPAGDYTAKVQTDHRRTLANLSFTVKKGLSTEIEQKAGTRTGEAQRSISVPRSAMITVRVHESRSDSLDGRASPAKITVLGETPPSPAFRGREPREYLYDLALGERMRPTDGIPDADDPSTRLYVERVLLAGADGLAQGELKPGKYVLLVSRGPEFTTVRLGAENGTLTFEEGQAYDFDASLTRVVDTTGWVSADFHVHSQNSIDGHIALDERVLSYAAEGVEFLTATDHNVVTDLGPNVEALGLQDFLKTIVGLEMTTLEMGHFNAFPIAFTPGTTRHGPFADLSKDDSRDPMAWLDLPPRLLFQTLRSMGTGPETVVQVNHPRDSILGYYSDFNVNADNGEPREGSLIASPNGPAFGVDKFSWQFDAMEVFNGKRSEMLKTYRMPDAPPLGSYPEIPIAFGSKAIVREPCPEPKPNPAACTPTDASRCASTESCDPDRKVCVCDYAKQEVAFPGAVDDWFQLLNMAGQSRTMPGGPAERIAPVTATGNSDSHGLYFEEAGYPRNWVRVDEDEPRKVDQVAVANAVKKHKVVLSNGPFLDVVAEGYPFDGTRTSPIGGLLQPTTDSVKLNITVLAAPWVRVDRVIVYVDGAEQKVIPIRGLPPGRTKRCCDERIELTGLTSDAWVVVAAEGDQSLFPYVTPLEQAPLQVADAIAAIAGPLGFGANKLGALSPSRVAPATPYALTNPIWIDRNGDGTSFGRSRDAIAIRAGESPLVAPGVEIELAEKPELPREAAGHVPQRSSDLRRLFRQWNHGHSH